MRNRTVSKQEVKFFFLNKNIQLTGRTRLKKFLPTLFRKEGKQLDFLSYIFCSDDYLLGINRDFLSHDYYTDIITFDLSESIGRVTGEIYISADRVRDNSVTHGSTLKEELHRVIFHGSLHLCGYKDKTQKDQKIMRQMEDKYLALYFK
jgi:probable rRNA maturation factor